MDAELQKQLTYLDDLRELGETNMYGAAQYLERAFGLSTTEARFVLQYWMDTFKARHPEIVRTGW